MVSADLRRGHWEFGTKTRALKLTVCALAARTLRAPCCSADTRFVCPATANECSPLASAVWCSRPNSTRTAATCTRVLRLAARTFCSRESSRRCWEPDTKNFKPALCRDALQTSARHHQPPVLAVIVSSSSSFRFTKAEYTFCALSASTSTATPTGVILSKILVTQTASMTSTGRN